MVEPAHHRLSISTQCRLLRISRSSYYYAPVPETDETLALMTVIDTTFLDCPWYGSRQMARHLRRNGRDVGRRRVRRLMAKMGLTPIYQRPRTSDPHPQHRVYPYLLRKLAIERDKLAAGRSSNFQVLSFESDLQNAENARLSLALTTPAPGKTWVLVTSAFHMPRAMRSFEAAGWAGLVPWPVDYRTSAFVDGMGWNLTRNLLVLNTAIREQVGQIAYRLTGR